MEIFKKLQVKFSENFNASLEVETTLIDEIDLKSKFIYLIGQHLPKEVNSKTRNEITGIFDEIFSDMTVSIYLAMCSLHTSSNTILRRVLELGIAVLYFWDMPHKYWGWKTINTHESDLNFKDNLEYLSSAPYLEYLRNEFEIQALVLDRQHINDTYRRLSNTIHGKFETFATSSPESFNFVKTDFTKNLSEIINIQNILLECFKKRFKNEYDEALNESPGIKRYNNGN